MTSGIDIRNALGSDVIGMVLVVAMIIGNIWRLRLKNRESRVLIAMLAICFVCCLSDLLSFAWDGGASVYSRVMVHGANTLLFAANAACAFSWFVFLKEHFQFEVGSTQRWILFFTMFTLFALLAANLFEPILFYVNEQAVYERRSGYWVYILVNYGVIINSLALYFRNFRQDGFIRFFPIWLYVIPIVVATVAQTLWYGVSLMAPSFAVAIAGAFTSLQNERVFRDHPTGLFNRTFLEYVLNLYSQRGRRASGLMISLRGFEEINEKHGHNVGDLALCKAADLIKASVGDWGSILRYSGDEFIIVVDSQYDEHISNCIEKLNMNFDRFNRTTLGPYKLIIAIGYKKYDEKKENVDTFLDGLKAAVKKARVEQDQAKLEQAEAAQEA